MKKLFTIACLLVAMHASAAISTHDAMRAILGESCGQPFAGKLAVACVIRNRGSLQGIYGAKVTNAWIVQQPVDELMACRRAWLESKGKDVTGGCRYFGSIHDDWYFIGELHMKPVMTIGGQRFYRN